MKEFLLRAQIRLGVTQEEFLNEFYIIDLLDILESKKRQDAEDMLAELSIKTAQYMKEESFKDFINMLKKEAGIAEEPQTFDRGAYERFKAIVKGR